MITKSIFYSLFASCARLAPMCDTASQVWSLTDAVVRYCVWRAIFFPIFKFKKITWKRILISKIFSMRVTWWNVDFHLYEMKIISVFKEKSLNKSQSLINCSRIVAVQHKSEKRAFIRLSIETCVDEDQSVLLSCFVISICLHTLDTKAMSSKLWKCLSSFPFFP